MKKRKLTTKECIHILKTYNKYCMFDFNIFKYILKKKNLLIIKKDLKVIKKSLLYLKKLIKAIKNDYDETHLKKFMSKHKDLLEYFI